MFGIVVISIVCALLTTGFIVAEIHWSIANVKRLFANKNLFYKIGVIPLIPACFLPVIWDVAITLGLSLLFGFSGMIGMMTSMVASSTIAGYLYYQRRKNGWRYA